MGIQPVGDEVVEQSKDVTESGAVVQEAVKKPSRREQAIDGLAFLRSGLLSTIVVLAIVAAMVVTIRDLTRTPVVLEEIGVPETLTKKGYTGLVASNMLWDAIEDIRTTTGDSKKRVRIQTASRQLDVVAPGSGLSLQRTTQVLRSLFNLPQTRIAGEFVCATSACNQDDLVLSIRVFTGEGTKIVSAGSIGEREMSDYFHDTALSLLQQEIDPLVAARYHYTVGGDTWRENAVRLSTEILVQRGSNAEEAATLLGRIAWDDQEYELALARSYDAIDVGDEVHSKRWFWSRNRDNENAIRAQTLLLQGMSLSGIGETKDDEDFYWQAIEVLEQARSYAPKDGLIATEQGWIMWQLGENADSAQYYREAAQLDKLDPYAWVDLAHALLDLEERDEAEKSFQVARNLAPENMLLVHYHATDSSFDEALSTAEEWAKEYPEDYQAWDLWVDLLYDKSYDPDNTLCDPQNGPVAEFLRVSSDTAPPDYPTYTVSDFCY